jgi:hypothetical protein
MLQQVQVVVVSFLLLLAHVSTFLRGRFLSLCLPLAVSLPKNVSLSLPLLSLPLGISLLREADVHSGVPHTLTLIPKDDTG